MKQTKALKVRGISVAPVSGERPGALEDLIFKATADALADAGIDIDAVDAVSLACSDVFDGRGISTMTLSGAAGSYRTTEFRVCDDGIAAIDVAQMLVLSGEAETVIVAAWSKFSDTGSVDQLLGLSVDPIFMKPVGIDGGVFESLQAQASGTTLTAKKKNPADSAVVLIVSGSGSEGTGRGFVLGTGLSTGAYGGLDNSPTIAQAAHRALTQAGYAMRDIGRIVLADGAPLDPELIRAAIDVPPEIEIVGSGADQEIGYAAGLQAVAESLLRNPTEPILVLAAAGLGGQAAYAAVVGGTDA